MLRALVEDLSRVGTYHLTVLASPTLERRLRSFPGVDVVPTQPENDLELLATWAPKVDACLLIAPEFRNLLLERLVAVREAGGKSLNCEPKYIRRTGDKQLYHDDLVGHHGRTPRTVPYSVDLVWEEFPAVIKPVDGAGSQASSRVENEAELHACARRAVAEGWEDLIVQPFIPGKACSMSFLCSGTSIPIPLRPTEQLLSPDNRLRYVGARYPLDAQTSHLLWDVARSEAWGSGWVGVDLVVGPRELGSLITVIEVNPRLTTSYLALRQRCHQNLADALVQVAAHNREVNLTWDPTPLEFRLE
jgi:predicted ATP-grasp superfamily ATP-dependent carboligase